MKRHNILRAVLGLLLAGIMFAGCSCDTAKLANDTPDGMKKIEMDIDDYNFYIPQEWTEDLATGVASAYLTDNSSVSMMTVQLDADTPDIEAYWEKAEKDFESTFGTSFEYDGEHPQKTLLGGVEANKYVYTATVTGTEYKFMQVVCAGQKTALLNEYNYAYVFTYTAEADKYDGHLDDIEEMLANFTFNGNRENTAD